MPGRTGQRETLDAEDEEEALRHFKQQLANGCGVHEDQCRAGENQEVLGYHQEFCLYLLQDPQETIR